MLIDFLLIILGVFDALNDFWYQGLIEDVREMSNYLCISDPSYEMSNLNGTYKDVILFGIYHQSDFVMLINDVNLDLFSQGDIKRMRYLDNSFFYKTLWWRIEVCFLVGKILRVIIPPKITLKKGSLFIREFFFMRNYPILSRIKYFIYSIFSFPSTYSSNVDNLLEMKNFEFMEIELTPKRINIIKNIWFYGMLIVLILVLPILGICATFFYWGPLIWNKLCLHLGNLSGITKDYPQLVPRIMDHFQFEKDNHDTDLHYRY